MVNNQTLYTLVSPPGAAKNGYVFAAGATTLDNWSTAPFNVKQDGSVTASNMTITGGSLTIGENFSVTNQGHLTAKSATIGG